MLEEVVAMVEEVVAMVEEEVAVDQSKTGSLPPLSLHVWWKQRRTRTKS